LTFSRQSNQGQCCREHGIDRATGFVRQWK